MNENDSRQALAAVIAGDEHGLRQLAELLSPYLLMGAAGSEPDRWLTTREAAEYAGTSANALHKAMAAREVHFEQDTPGGKAWFRRADIELRMHIMDLMRMLLDKGVALVIITVNLADSLSLADKLIRIRRNKPEEVYTRDEFSSMPVSAPWIDLYREAR